MLSTTDAIVLSLQPHSDKAHVLHAYTRACGRVNYMVYGLGRKHAIGLYTPLSVVRITSSSANGRPHAVKEAVPLSTNVLTNDPYKSAIALFISEVLYHVLRHPMPDEPMYAYLEQAVKALNESDAPENFHLAFLVGLADKLGFAMEEVPVLPKTRQERQKQIRALCAYFEEHVETWQAPKSLDVLMEVFD